MRFQNITVGAIAVSTMFIVELTMVPLLLPSIQSELSLTTNQLAWLFNSYGLCVAVGVLLGGWFGDAIQLGKVFAAGVFAFASGSLAVAFAPTLDLMIVGRMIQGLGAGIFSPLIPILLTKAAPDQPGKALMIWGSVSGVVAALAPLIYSMAFNNPDYRYVFILLAAASLLGLWVVFAGPTTMLSKTEDRSPPSLSGFIQANGLFNVFGYVICTYGAFTYFLFRFPLILTAAGQEPYVIGMILSAMWLSYSMLSTAMKNYVDGPRLSTILMAAPILIAFGFILLTVTDDLVWHVIAGLSVAAGLACSNTPSLQLILRFAPKGQDALSASLDITFARLGGVVTVALLATASLQIATILMVCMSVAGLIYARYAINGMNAETAG